MDTSAVESPRTPDPFGRTLALEHGDLVLRHGDLVLVEGERELAQGLRVMIATPFGSDLFNVEVGFDVASTLIQPLNRRLLQMLIRLGLVRSLALDDRVIEVRDVVFDDDPRFFELVPGSDSETARRSSKAARRFRAAVLLTTHRLDNPELTLTLEGPVP